MSFLSRLRDLRHNKLAKVVIGGSAFGVGAVGTAFATTSGQVAEDHQADRAADRTEIDLEGDPVVVVNDDDLLSDDLDAGTLTVDSPDSPETPETPETPESPATADSPVTPESPESPVTPESPESPESPVTPESPESPVTPESPESPVTPESPESPETPDTPDDEDDD